VQGGGWLQLSPLLNQFWNGRQQPQPLIPTAAKASRVSIQIFLIARLLCQTLPGIGWLTIYTVAARQP
jgi:hypothetical protein